MSAYTYGDTVAVRLFDGMIHRILVDEIEDDVKNGRPGGSGIDENGVGRWFYDDQIEFVL
jgi:hypothetical protein